MVGTLFSGWVNDLYSHKEGRRQCGGSGMEESMYDCVIIFLLRYNANHEKMWKTLSDGSQGTQDYESPSCSLSVARVRLAMGLDVSSLSPPAFQSLKYSPPSYASPVLAFQANQRCTQSLSPLEALPCDIHSLVLATHRNPTSSAPKETLDPSLPVLP